MRRKLFPSTYNPARLVLMLPLGIFVGYTAGFIYGISTIPSSVPEQEFLSDLTFDSLLGASIGLAVAVANEMRVARRSRL
jgi:hypothetical protein